MSESIKWFLTRQPEVYNINNLNIILYIVLILLISLSSNTIPLLIKKLLNSYIFRILIVTLIAYSSFYNPLIAILITIGFIVSIDLLNKTATNEAFGQIKEYLEYEHFKNII